MVKITPEGLVQVVEKGAHGDVENLYNCALQVQGFKRGSTNPRDVAVPTGSSPGLFNKYTEVVIPDPRNPRQNYVLLPKAGAEGFDCMPPH